MKINIYVVQKDIDEGVKNNSEKCVVARAIDRRLYKEYFARVEYGYIDIMKMVMNDDGIEYRKQLHRIATPDSVAEYISVFDLGSKSDIKPVKFPLSIPKKYLKA